MKSKWMTGLALTAMLAMASCVGARNGGGETLASPDGYEAAGAVTPAQLDALVTAEVAAREAAAQAETAAREAAAVAVAKATEASEQVAALPYRVIAMDLPSVNWLVGTLIALATGALAWLIRKGLTKAKASQAVQDAADKCMEILKNAINNTYHSFVRGAKKANEDGKLTDEEVAQARKMARDEAVTEAAKVGIDLLKTLGEASIPRLIDSLVVGAKKNGESEASLPAPA